MSERFQTIGAKGITLAVDLKAGHLRALEIEHGARRLRPLHTAPWVDDPAVAQDPGVETVLKCLSGDFFCAPFGASDVEDGPSHGWPANSSWSTVSVTSEGGRTTARFALDRPVMGARLIKELTLRDGHPFVYVRHTFEGGSGAMPVASHAMTRFDKPGRLSFSPKAFAELPPTQQESDPARGRSVFARGVRTTDLSKLPLADGDAVDLHRYPVADRHEDFVMLVEAAGSPLGWTAALRPGAGDIMLSLKNPRDFPVTFLWFSNGGRDYAPWNSRHFGVLGIEEGRSYSAAGHAASSAPNPLSRAGVPTALTLEPGGTVSVRHVLGGTPLPEGWEAVESMEAHDGVLLITGDKGKTVEHPFDGDFLK